MYKPKPKPKQSFIPHTILLSIPALLAACSTSISPPDRISVSPVPTTVTACESFNQGDPLDSKLGTNGLTIKAYLDRREHSGRSTVIIPINGSSQTFWMHRNDKGGWQFAEKQTVAIAETGLLDLQPMHRISATAYPEIIQVIALSQKHWEKKITIQPVLEGTTSRRGKVIPYPVHISVQGAVHPFRNIEKGISGDALPDYLNRILDQLEPGSIYIPQNAEIEEIEPTIANPQICPATRSTFPSH